MTLTTEELEAVAHRLDHYRTSHGDLALIELPRWTCDAEDTPAILKVGYADVREVFAELAARRRAMSQ